MTYDVTVRVTMSALNTPVDGELAARIFVQQACGHAISTVMNDGGHVFAIQVTTVEPVR